MKTPRPKIMFQTKSLKRYKLMVKPSLVKQDHSLHLFENASQSAGAEEWGPQGRAFVVGESF